MAKIANAAPEPEPEREVDFMADAPAERPYAEAMSNEQRALLGLVEEPKP